MIREALPVSGRTQQSALGYQLHVFLSGSHPLIWRRVQVPANAKLDWLHAVLQVAIGWTNSHLHQYVSGDRMYSDPRAGIETYEGDPPVLDERKHTLSTLLEDNPEGFVYDYDFGDSWEHQVVVEKSVKLDAPMSTTALCLDGARACPPEDCGGLGGYVELLKALKNKKHPEHKNMREWLGRPFDPGAFDVAKTNHWLQKLKWPRTTEGQLRKILMARDGYHE